MQGNYFTAVDLAEIGQKLDQEERLVGGTKRGSESQNYDDSGYFSIQVSEKTEIGQYHHANLCIILRYFKKRWRFGIWN